MGDPDFFQVNLILNQKQDSSVDKVFLYLCWRATVRCHLIGQNVIYKCISKRTTSLFIISNPKGTYISLVQYCYNHVSCKYFILKKRIQDSSAMVSGDYFMFLFHLTKSSCSCRQSIGQNVILSSNSLPTLSSSQQQSKRTILNNNFQQ